MAKQTTRTLDDDTSASDPGKVTLSDKKLRILRPDLYGVFGCWNALMIGLGKQWPQKVYLEEQLQNGDSRAAVVVSTEPLLVAAYTDELDCVALLKFPATFDPGFTVARGTRLLTVNCYGSNEERDSDLTPGPDDLGQWTGFHPLIADFLSDDLDRIEIRKREISEDEWERAERMGMEYLKRQPHIIRDGSPVFSSTPATSD